MEEDLKIVDTLLQEEVTASAYDILLKCFLKYFTRQGYRFAFRKDDFKLIILKEESSDVKYCNTLEEIIYILNEKRYEVMSTSIDKIFRREDSSSDSS